MPRSELAKKNDLLSNYYNFPREKKRDNLYDIANIQSNDKQILMLLQSDIYDEQSIKECNEFLGI